MPFPFGLTLTLTLALALALAIVITWVVPAYLSRIILRGCYPGRWYRSQEEPIVCKGSGVAAARQSRRREEESAEGAQAHGENRAPRPSVAGIAHG